MNMNEEIRTLQYLIADLTKKTSTHTSTEIIQQVKKPSVLEVDAKHIQAQDSALVR